MGTSMSFYLVENRGLAQADVLEGIRALQEKTDGRNKGRLEMLQGIWKSMGAENQGMEILQNVMERPSPVVAAFREDARWLPVFETNLCEGHCASREEMDLISEQFKAPALSFFILDSDVLYIRYSDAAQGRAESFARGNCTEMEEEYYDEDYRYEFPEFLRAYCKESDWARLEEIWSREDYVFADDRMGDVCALIGAELLCDGERIPEGYAKVTG